MNRREWLHAALGLAAGAIPHPAFSQTRILMRPATPPVVPNPLLQKPAMLLPYVDTLPIPTTIRNTGATLDIVMREFQHRAHRDLPGTRMWGYNSMWPGPTIEVRRNQPLSVRWVNNLPVKHFLPIDRTIHGADESVPDVRTVVHLHGAQTLPEHDGYPEAWTTSDGKTGPTWT